MNCEFEKPDCFNCPYSECIATLDDIKRQWRHDRKYKRRDSADYIPKSIAPSVIPIRIERRITHEII